MEARAAGAAILATISFALVFTAGRMSTWVVPVADAPQPVGDARDATDARDPRRVRHPGEPRAAPSHAMIEAPLGEAKPNPSTPTAPSRAEAPRQPPGEAARAVAQEAVRGTEVTASQPKDPPAHEVPIAQPMAPRTPVVINAGSQPKELGAGQAAQDRDGASDNATELCERRYSSFRRSDGTYQPFDGGPRKRCPLLR